MSLRGLDAYLSPPEPDLVDEQYEEALVAKLEAAGVPTDDDYEALFREVDEKLQPYSDEERAFTLALFPDEVKACSFWVNEVSVYVLLSMALGAFREAAGPSFERLGAYDAEREAAQLEADEKAFRDYQANLDELHRSGTAYDMVYGRLPALTEEQELKAIESGFCPICEYTITSQPIHGEQDDFSPIDGTAYACINPACNWGYTDV